MTDTQKSRKSTKVFSKEERAAMVERAKELKAEGSRSGKRAESDGEADLRAKIAEMPKADRDMAERIHALIMKTAPDLSPRTWYGMPGWAKEGKLICFFQSADKFKSRYATFGFEAAAKLDDGNMWPTSFALTKLTAADERKIAALVKKAVS
jgi:hypothetical protein